MKLQKTAQNHLGIDSTRPLESAPKEHSIKTQIALEPPQMT